MKPFVKIPLVITSPWGWRTHPISGEKQFHNGIDIRAIYEFIYAPESGIIAYTGNNSRSGKFLGLKLPDGRVLEFIHLDEIYVTKGDEIKEGFIVAKSGNSGWSTAPHIHFSIKTWNESASKYEAHDPTKYVKNLWVKQVILATIFGVPALVLIALGFYYLSK